MEEQSYNNLSSFKINFNSIQGRTTFAFLFTVTVGLILLFITDYGWRTVNAKKDIVINQIKPITIESVKLLNLIKITQTNLSQYLYLEDDSLEKNNKKIWLIDIPNQKDTLRNRVNSLKDPEITNQFTIINKNLSELKRQQREFERLLSTSQSKKLAKYQIKNDVLFVYQEIEKSFEDLLREVKHKEKRLMAQISSQQAVFYRVIIFAIITGFLICYFVGIRLFIGIFTWLRETKNSLKALSTGNIPEPVSVEENEFRSINTHINQLIHLLGDLKTYSQTVGEGNFDQQNDIFDANSELGQSLHHMNLSLQNVYNEERKRNWTSEGLADFSELLRAESNNVDNLCRKLVSKLVKYLDIIQGGIFILIRDEYGQSRFQLKGAYAYGRDKFVEKSLEPQEGLLGRVYKEQEVVLLTDLPDDYTYITSGLGSTPPRALILLPLLTDEKEVIGVVELASLHQFEEYQIAFLEKLCNNITATLTLMQTTQENQKILEEASRFSDLQPSTDITTKKNFEDLNLHKDDLMRILKDLKSRNKKLSSILEGLQEGIIITNPRGKIEIFSRGAERIFDYKKTDMIGRTLSALIPNEFGIELDSLIQSYSDARLDTPKNGTQRNIIAQKKNGTQFPVYLSLSEILIDNQKFFAAVVREI